MANEDDGKIVDLASYREKKSDSDSDSDSPLTLVGFDPCLAGTAIRFGMDGAVYCYDVDKVLAKIIAESDPRMSQEDAVDYFDYNILGSWMGEGTPIFFWKRLQGDEI